LLDEKLLDIDQKIESHRAKLADLQERLVQTKTIPDHYEELIRSFCEITLLGIDNFTEQEKRAVIELLDIHVFVKRGTSRPEDIFEITGFIPTTQAGSKLPSQAKSDDQTCAPIASNPSLQSESNNKICSSIASTPS
jgi:hypothetical protein